MHKGDVAIKQIPGQKSGQLKLGALKVAVAGLAIVIALGAWVAVLVGTDIDKDQQIRVAQARATNLAVVFEEQIYRQILSIDQTLRVLKLDWERNPNAFDFRGLQRRAGSMSDVVSQLEILDARGRVIGGTQHELLDSDMSARRFFTAHRSNDNFGPLTTGPFQNNGDWYLNISRRLNGPIGTFAGVIVASYDLNALMRDMAQADLGPRGMIMLVGRDGLVRAVSLHGVHDPGADISDTPLFHALFTEPDATWTGASGSDKDVRIHAWRPIPNQDMTLVVGLGPCRRRGQLRSAAQGSGVRRLRSDGSGADPGGGDRQHDLRRLGPRAAPGGGPRHPGGPQTPSLPALGSVRTKRAFSSA